MAIREAVLWMGNKYPTFCCPNFLPNVIGTAVSNSKRFCAICPDYQRLLAKNIRSSYLNIIDSWKGSSQKLLKCPYGLGFKDFTLTLSTEIVEMLVR